MKTYQGKVTVDNRRLPEHYEIKQFTKWGFEWTYEGASPRQLALAILYDHLGDKDRAIALSEPFMRKDDARRAQFAARRMALQVP